MFHERAGVIKERLLFLDYTVFFYFVSKRENSKVQMYIPWCLIYCLNVHYGG